MDAPAFPLSEKTTIKALRGTRTLDLRFTKPSLCQAELLGQNKGNFSSTLFNASR
jgi:hypothetical protein